MAEHSERAKGLLDKWFKDTESYEKAHYCSAMYSRVYNYALGIPLVILTTFIASDIFVKMSNVVEKTDIFSKGMNALAWIVIPVSILLPILAGLQTFLRFPERAMQHKEAAIKFGLLKNEIEKTLNFQPQANELIEKVNGIHSEYNRILLESPSAGAISLKKARKKKK